MKSKFNEIYNVILESNCAKDAKKNVKPKGMHKALGIPVDKKITDVYKSGKKLAKDLVAAVGKKKAAGMINFVANISSKEELFIAAQKALSKIEED